MHLSMEQTQGDVDSRLRSYELPRARSLGSHPCMRREVIRKAKVNNKFLIFFLVYSS